eukprot:7208253-Pyramimonas_sp.AAC.2
MRSCSGGGVTERLTDAPHNHNATTFHGSNTVTCTELSAEPVRHIERLGCQSTEVTASVCPSKTLT